LFFTVQEVTPEGDPVSSFNLSDCTVDLSSSKKRAQAVSYVYSVTVPNAATIQINTSQLAQPAAISFAGNTTNVPSNSVQYVIEISEWHFDSPDNNLQILLSVNGESTGVSQCTNVSTGLGGSGNLGWISMQVEGATLFGNFFQYGIVDDHARALKISLQPTDVMTTTTIPHFTNQAEIAGVFSVFPQLTPSSSCFGTGDNDNDEKSPSKDGFSSTATIGIVVGGAWFVGGAAVGAVAFIMIKKKQKTQRAKFA